MNENIEAIDNIIDNYKNVIESLIAERKILTTEIYTLRAEIIRLKNKIDEMHYSPEKYSEAWDER